MLFCSLLNKDKKGIKLLGNKDDRGKGFCQVILQGKPCGLIAVTLEGDEEAACKCNKKKGLTQPEQSWHVALRKNKLLGQDAECRDLGLQKGRHPWSFDCSPCSCKKDLISYNKYMHFKIFLIPSTNPFLILNYSTASLVLLGNPWQSRYKSWMSVLFFFK